MMLAQPLGAQEARPGFSWPRGIQTEIAYVADFFGSVAGGRDRDAVYLDNLDLLLSLDLEALLGVGKTTLRAHVQSNRGGSATSMVGDFQGLSNIEAPHDWRLYELWLEQNAVPGRVSLLGGIYDLNAEFDVIPVAGDFLNSSFGFGPDYSATGLSGPSTFPLTSLGFRVKTRPWPFSYIALSVSDGAPGDPGDPERSRFALGGGEGALISWELGYRRVAPGAVVVLDEPPARVQSGGRRIGRGRTSERLRTKLSVGGWGYTAPSDPWDDQPRRKSWGAYVLGERLILGTPDGIGISVFGRAGFANTAVNRLGGYVGGGLVTTGLLPGRSADVAGVGVAHARNGTPFLEAQARAGAPLTRSETALEVFYALELSEGLRLQPDVQWVIDPGMEVGLDNALVVGLRGLASFSLP